MSTAFVSQQKYITRMRHLYLLMSAMKVNRELARGLRYAQQRVLNLPTISATRYQTWLTNAGQLPGHLERGSLVVDPLILDELPRREAIQTQYGIGRGEAACLVLAERYHSIAVFLSMAGATLRDRIPQLARWPKLWELLIKPYQKLLNSG